MTEQERLEKFGPITDDDYWMRGLRWDHCELPMVMRSRHFVVPVVPVR